MRSISFTGHRKLSEEKSEFYRILKLADYAECRAKVLELFPTGHTPTVEDFEKK